MRSHDIRNYDYYLQMHSFEYNAPFVHTFSICSFFFVGKKVKNNHMFISNIDNYDSLFYVQISSYTCSLIVLEKSENCTEWILTTKSIMSIWESLLDKFLKLQNSNQPKNPT